MATVLEEILHDLMLKHKLKLACAESCTGGLVSHRITNVSGSSEYFSGGIVSYSNEAKAGLLGVSRNTLNSVGAVSEETVREMARGARRTFDADIAVSISGIAGPSGGTQEKPIGTTWIGLATKEREWARHFVWDGDRERNKHYSSEAALQFVIDYLQGKVS